MTKSKKKWRKNTIFIKIMVFFWWIALKFLKIRIFVMKSAKMTWKTTISSNYSDNLQENTIFLWKNTKIITNMQEFGKTTSFWALSWLFWLCCRCKPSCRTQSRLLCYTCRTGGTHAKHLHHNRRDNMAACGVLRYTAYKKCKKIVREEKSRLITVMI